MRKSVLFVLLWTFGTANAAENVDLTVEQIMSVSASIVVEQVKVIQAFCKDKLPAVDLSAAVANIVKHRDDNFKPVNTPKYEQVRNLSLVELKVHTFIRIQAQGSEAMLCHGAKDNWANTTKEMFVAIVQRTYPGVRSMLGISYEDVHPNRE